MLTQFVSCLCLSYVSFSVLCFKLFNTRRTAIFTYLEGRSASIDAKD